MHFPYVNSDSREKCIEYIFQYCFQKSSEKCIRSPNPLFYRCKFFSLRKTIHFFKQTRTKLAAYDPYWRLLTSPMVEQKHVHFPYVNSDSREKRIEYIFQYCFQKSSEKCIGSPNPLFYRCKFFRPSKTIHFFKKLERNSPHLIPTGGS